MLDEELLERWDRFLEVREVVTKALEDARVNKVIGQSLEARVKIKLPGDLYKLFKEWGEDQLSRWLIVSKVELEEGDRLGAFVDRAQGEKCERCWRFHEDVVEGLCPRCRGVLEELKAG